MALSGKVTTGEYSNRSVTLNWSATQDIANNRSTISWNLKGSGSYSGWVRVSEVRIKINGSQVYYRDSSHHTDAYNGTQICSGSTIIGHNSDGSKSFSISVEAGICQWAINKSGSGTFSLNTIPRASQPSVNTWPNSVSSVNIGDQIVIHMNKKASFTHKVTATFGNKSEVVTNSCVDNVTWNGFTIAAYAGQIPNATSGTLKFTVDTMNGSTKIGTKTVTVTANLPSSVVPSCSISALTNTNNVFNCYAKLLSGVKVKPSASGSYGSSISNITIEVTDKSSKSATSGTEYTFDPFSSTGSKTIKVSVKDSRGRTASTSKTITVSDYSYPTVSLSASRGDGSTVGSFVATDTGAYAKIVSKGSVSSISGNTLTPVLQYRVNGSSAWTNLSISTSSLSLSNTQVISASDTEAYDIRLTIRDKAGKEAVANMTLSNGFATMDFKAGGDGIAFGKTANRSGFDCAMLMRIFKGVNLMNENTPGGYGWSDWYYNNNGTQGKRGRIYANSDGIHLKAENGKGFLDGTWSGSLSDRRMKRDIEPIVQNIIDAVGEVPFKQFRMSAPDYDHEVLYVGILAQDLQRSFQKHGVADKLLMLDTRKLNPDDEDEYYCIEYTHFLIVRLLYDEMKLQAYDERLKNIEKILGI